MIVKFKNDYFLVSRENDKIYAQKLDNNSYCFEHYKSKYEIVDIELIMEAINRHIEYLKEVEFYEKCDEIARTAENEEIFDEKVFELAQSSNMLHVYDKNYNFIKNYIYKGVKQCQDL